MYFDVAWFLLSQVHSDRQMHREPWWRQSVLFCSDRRTLTLHECAVQRYFLVVSISLYEDGVYKQGPKYFGKKRNFFPRL